MQPQCLREIARNFYRLRKCKSMEPGGVEPPSRDSQRAASTRVVGGLISTKSAANHSTFFRCGPPPAERAEAASFFLQSIDESLSWIKTVGRYNNDQQREDVRELFRRGREVYAGLAD